MAKLTALVVPFLFLLAGCGKNASEELSRISEEFVNTTISFSPSTATGVGLHQYQGKNLDEMLDDLSAASLERQRRFYEDSRQRLAALPAEKLTAEDRADLGILQDQISLALLELNETQSYLHNPTVYVETLGNALFSPYVLEYAPKPERFRHIIARLGAVPLFLDQASTNLTSAPGEWTKVAIDENAGNINLVEKTLSESAPADLRESYRKAAAPALAAMHKFQDYLKNSLAARNSYGWQLGRNRYTRKFQYVLSTGTDPATMLGNAERELGQVRARMLQLALPLHHALAPSHGDHANLAGAERENQVIGEVLAHIADRHSTRESYVADARQDLEEARQFVIAKRLLTLPPRANLQVIDTPEFMRGIYSVGGFSSAPALEPQLGAFYWITPIATDWPKERAESKLREYNFYKLKLLTVHEAIPGHYVQAEYANDVQPKPRRILRSVFGNGPYVEGWAQYATQAMLDEGFLDRSPELALTFAKEELRVLANAIIDVRLQMLGMTDQEALDLMQKQTFQETEEATGKLQRAKLSSCQLPMYYVGWRGWLSVREGYRQAKGTAYNLTQFNDDALREGAVPLPTLAKLLAR